MFDSRIPRRVALGALAAAASLVAIGPIGVAEANSSGIAIPKEPAFAKGDPAAYGLQIAKYADAYDAGWVDQYSKGKMTLFDARGDSVQREIKQMFMEGRSGNKSLVRFMRPAEIRGVAALTHEHPKTTDDSWLYLPASRRVRRISGANRSASFQGTEFTYEDLSSFEVERYAWRFLKDGSAGGGASYVLQAKPNYKDTGYSKLVVNVSKKHWRADTIVYFDKAGRKLKTLTSGKWEQVHGRFWRAKRLDMVNHQTGKRTLLELRSLFVNLALYPKKGGGKRDGLSADRFTKRALEKG
jgi:Outer membrane lipoprotein-sorting protein